MERQKARTPAADFAHGRPGSDPAGELIDRKSSRNAYAAQVPPPIAEICCTALPLTKLDDAMLAREAAVLIGILADAQSRKRIADAWLTGWVTGDTAMEALIACELIEFSTGVMP